MQICIDSRCLTEGFGTAQTYADLAKKHLILECVTRSILDGSPPGLVITVGPPTHQARQQRGGISVATTPLLSPSVRPKSGLKTDPRPHSAHVTYRPVGTPIALMVLPLVPRSIQGENRPRRCQDQDAFPCK